MCHHRSGFNPANESVATHSRKRYRIVASRTNTPYDPSLSIVHYSRAPQNDHVPTPRIPITPQVQNMMSQRRFLHNAGQLSRKEFMLHDRNSWPTVPFPPQAPQQGFNQPQAPYANPAAAHARPGFYPPGHPAAAQAPHPASKPQRAPRNPSAAMNAAISDFGLEDEDVSNGDMMDNLNPREVSKMRYMQHHEWMEEVLTSPYAISQITPVSLGLGRKGELQALTAGFFDAPAQAQEDDAQEATKLEPAKAEEFAERVSKKVADIQAEIEKLKKQHARRMERFNRSSLFKDSELRLREAATEPEETGPEVWRLEGRVIIPSEEDEAPQAEYVEKAKYKVTDVVREVESAWKTQIVPEPKVSCVEKGGLLEKIEPEQKEEPDAFAADMVLDQASDLLNQFGSPGVGANAAPQAMPTDIPGDVDIHMGGQLDGAGDGGDWVMVDNENKDTGAGAGEASLEGANFDFTNMDSAGDALAAYSEQNDGLDLPDLENSAFGDAFHASDNEHSHHPDADEMS